MLSMKITKLFLTSLHIVESPRRDEHGRLDAVRRPRVRGPGRVPRPLRLVRQRGLGAAVQLPDPRVVLVAHAVRHQLVDALLEIVQT